MSKEIGAITTHTPTATADTTNLVDATYPMCLQGVAGQRNMIYEVQLGGQAGVSAPTFMLLSRNSTAGGTLSKGTGLTQAFLDAMSTALAAPAVIYNTTTTKPQRSATAHLLNLSFNAFGGIVRWVAAPGEEIVMSGAAQPGGDTSLSAFTGGTVGLMSAHMIFETM